MSRSRRTLFVASFAFVPFAAFACGSSSGKDTPSEGTGGTGIHVVGGAGGTGIHVLGGAGGATGGSGAAGGSAGAAGSNAGGSGGATVMDVTCQSLSPLPGGGCSVTMGDGSRLLVGTVLAPDAIYRGGSVLVGANGTISCVGCDCAEMATTATVVTCPEGVISPGLINPHDHITYAQNSPYTDTGERYEHRNDWRKGENGHTKISATGSASNDQMSWQEVRFLLGGATSTVGSGGPPGLLRNLDKAALEEGVNHPPVDYDTFPLGDSNGTELTSGCGYPSIKTTSAIAKDDAYFPHLGEGIGAAAENEFVCTSSGANDLIQPQTAVIHGVGFFSADYADMAKNGTMLIWSPRSNITLYGNTATVTAAARTGVSIALGTDWMPTGSMNMQRELHCADTFNQTYLHGFFSDRDLWEMVTIRAAQAAAFDDIVGALAPGKLGDIAIFDASMRADYRAVIDARPEDTLLVLRDGKALYGNASIVTALGTGCDPVTVCNASKAICLMSEIGKTWTQLSTTNASLYPAFFCGDPTNEPSCIPSRPKSVNGSTVYDGTTSASDADGDGIPDATDDCPSVFNPVRPMDNGKQADSDMDGQGDACDACPLDAMNTCGG